MRFIKYLNEQSNEEILSILEKNCNKFLKILPKGKFLYRGIHNKSNLKISEIEVKKRNSLNAPTKIFNILNS